MIGRIQCSCSRMGRDRSNALRRTSSRGAAVVFQNGCPWKLNPCTRSIRWHFSLLSSRGIWRDIQIRQTLGSRVHGLQLRRLLTQRLANLLPRAQISNILPRASTRRHRIVIRISSSSNLIHLGLLQESTGRIGRSNGVHDHAGNGRLFHLGRVEVLQLILLHELSKAPISRVIVGETTTTEEYIVLINHIHMITRYWLGNA
mmetsp:Transcript_15117/g.22293  ORF Transcript_15117/g.22293 Transcript_15117/m.22293 type:complete len:202 (+) Transcript_15117:678-1283(+)